MLKRLGIGLAVVAVLALVATGVAVTQLPGIGAGALLYPARHINSRAMPAACVERKFAGNDVLLEGWQCRSTAAERRGTIVYLHGIADNRGSAVEAITRLLPLGFDVVAYDGRAHGGSEGNRCTYGYFEKRDLQKVIDALGVDSVILIGHSLGAAVALQAAAVDPRVTAVVAASSFADLRSIATERAPSVFSPSLIDASFARAEHDAHFVVNEVSPLLAAASLTIPAFIIHGERDTDTRPAHSRRLFAALRGPKELLIVPGVEHNNVLGTAVWARIEKWLMTVAPRAASPLK